jgi:hypothetical protein
MIGKKWIGKRDVMKSKENMQDDVIIVKAPMPGQCGLSVLSGSSL